MTWIFVLVAVLLVLGPLFALLPSAREREQQVFRRHARQQGVQVELCRIDDPDPSPDAYVSITGQALEARIPCIAYRRHPSRSVARREVGPLYRFVRKRLGHTQELPETWHRTDQSQAVMPAPLKAHLVRELERLPADVISVEWLAGTTSVYWRELGGQQALEAVIGFLLATADLSLPDDPGAGDATVPEAENGC